MTTTENAAKGRIVSVTGPVVDVEFPRGAVPELFNALKVEIEFGRASCRERVYHPV